MSLFSNFNRSFEFLWAGRQRFVHSAHAYDVKQVIEKSDSRPRVRPHFLIIGEHRDNQIKSGPIFSVPLEVSTYSSVK